MPRKLLVVLMSTVVLSGCVVRVVGTSRPRVAPPPPVAAEVEFAVFYDRLRPYGSWVVSEEYGQVWVPAGMGPEWRPYVDGHWVYTEDGWLWVSDYEWGWAPFHYGRWARHPRYRWVWIPGTVWAPAWVTWRHGDGVVGWAPLGPRARWQSGVGLLDDDERDLAPDAWCFVGERELTRPVIREVARPVVQNVVIIRRTTNVTRYTVVNNRVVNAGVDVRHHEERTGRAVPRYRTVDRDDAGPVAVQGSEIRVYRPSRPREEPVIDERELRRRQDLERRKLEADQEVERREEAAARRREQADADATRRRQQADAEATRQREQADAEAARRREQSQAAAAGRRQDPASGRGPVVGQAVPRDPEVRRQQEDEARRRQEQEKKVMEDRRQEEKRSMTERQVEEREGARKNKENEKEQAQAQEQEQEKGKARRR